MLAIRGVYRDGIIKLDEYIAPLGRELNVIITFLDEKDRKSAETKVDFISLASEASLAEDWNSAEDERYEKIFEG